ncbi:hypothetical protein U3A58_08780 [Algoriphagus sp. C2-6-M1]|uniref:hypothetical protein n=1 Tax=Algoriphagus persicinus TaxID=3108754 RepID=UPI002B39AFD5|nr:hypothetical protein [Algoriphagus sp. C2-6-M1]MEB2780486.1 hypothetical protein [Algoriphagus sp. C2-6-M1]
MALLKFEKDQSKLHVGAAFNQQTQKLIGTTYEQVNQYKTAQFGSAAYALFDAFPLDSGSD